MLQLLGKLSAHSVVQHSQWLHAAAAACSYLAVECSQPAAARWLQQHAALLWSS
jgi:hypothetical protein